MSAASSGRSNSAATPRLRLERSLSFDSSGSHKFEAVPDGLTESPLPTRSHESASTRALTPDDFRVLQSGRRHARGECIPKHGNPLRGRGSAYEMQCKKVSTQKSTHRGKCFRAASDIPRREQGRKGGSACREIQVVGRSCLKMHGYSDREGDGCAREQDPQTGDRLTRLI